MVPGVHCSSFQMFASRVLSSPTIARKHNDFQLSLPYLRAPLVHHIRLTRAVGKLRVCASTGWCGVKINSAFIANFFRHSADPFGSVSWPSRRRCDRPNEEQVTFKTYFCQVFFFPSLFSHFSSSHHPSTHHVRDLPSFHQEGGDVQRPNVH